MSFVALADTLTPGSAGRLGAVLVSPVLASGSPLVSSAVFVQDELLVRAYQFAEKYDVPGTEADLAAALAAVPEVAELQELLVPFLAQPPGPAGALTDALRGSLMRRVQQRVVRRVPASLSALRYRVRPGSGDAITQIFTAVQPEARPVLRDGQGARTGVLHGVAVFVKDTAMVRVVAYDGELFDVAQYMAHRPGRPEAEARLAPYLEGDRDVAAPEAFLRAFTDITMDRLALSAPAGALGRTR
ncbi:SchA/CurD-like domain-containing protein [Streptomyces acidicola]|uniref:SchA/CurD-like domain-containing protein n=1 Tax=Streptomyces acidicola TaxID=2596892 RepID=UPI003827F054